MGNHKKNWILYLPVFLALCTGLLVADKTYRLKINNPGTMEIVIEGMPQVARMYLGRTPVFDKALLEVRLDVGARVTLRSSPRTISKDEVKEMLKSKGFFDSEWNKSGNFANDYDSREINGEKVVMDHATGLIWHQSGSEKYMNSRSVKQWTAELNSRGYAGYRDWRLPTLEEAASLLENRQMNGELFIDPKFSVKQNWIWTSDRHDSGRAWVVVFDSGFVDWLYVGDYPYVFVRPVRSGQ